MNCHVRAIASACCFFAFSLTLLAQDQGKPLPFRTAIELALRNSANSGIARADLARDHATVNQARDLFLPNVSVGAALGYSHGFPLSLEGAAPSLFNVNIGGYLLNFAQ